MDEDQYRNLVQWHRNTQKAIARLEWFVGVIFFATVIAPMMKYYGLWNLGW